MASTEIATTLINLKSLFIDILSNPEIFHTSKLLKSLVQLLDTLLSQPSPSTSSLLSFTNNLDSPLYTQTTQLRSEFYSLEHVYSQFESRLRAKDYVLSNAASEVAFLRSEIAQLANCASALPTAINALSPSEASERLRDLSQGTDRITAQCIHAEMEAAARRQALQTRVREMDLLAARTGEFPQMRELSFHQFAVSQPPSPTSAVLAMPPEPPSKGGMNACTPSTITSPSPSMLVPSGHKSVQVPPLMIDERSRHGSSSGGPPSITAITSGSTFSSVSPAMSFKTKQTKSARSSSSSSSASAPSIVGNGGGGAKIVKPLQPIKFKEGGFGSGVEEVALQTPGRKGNGKMMNSARSVSGMGISKKQKILKDQWMSTSVGEYAKILPEDILAMMDACGYVVTKQMAKYILNQMSPKNDSMVTWESFYRVMTDQMSKLRPSK